MFLQYYSSFTLKDATGTTFYGFDDEMKDFTRYERILNTEYTEPYFMLGHSYWKDFKL